MLLNATVLVVDDDENLLDVLRSELQDEGYTVLTANNGEEGLEAVRSHRPSAVVLDIKMPKLDGMQVLQVIRKEFPEIRVIMLTSYKDLGSAMECRALGAVDFIEKPFELADLTASLHHALKGGVLMR